MVVEDFTEPDVRLDYGRMANHSPSNNARGGVLQSRNDEVFKTADTYSGFDRFGRVTDQRWYDCGVSADAARARILAIEADPTIEDK